MTDKVVDMREWMNGKIAIHAQQAASECTEAEHWLFVMERVIKQECGNKTYYAIESELKELRRLREGETMREQ